MAYFVWFLMVSIMVCGRTDGATEQDVTFTLYLKHDSTSESNT